MEGVLAWDEVPLKDLGLKMEDVNRLSRRSVENGRTCRGNGRGVNCVEECANQTEEHEGWWETCLSVYAGCMYLLHSLCVYFVFGHYYRDLAYLILLHHYNYVHQMGVALL